MSRISYLGIIPARGGSKGIPRKNIKTIAGKPLIAWSIEAAQTSGLLSRVVLSTEDKEIVEIAESLGVEVLDRPVELATDEATTVSTIEHVLKAINAEAVVLLQPTSPVRDKGLIDRCIKRFEETRVDCLATGFVCKYKEYGSYTQRRQDMRGFFYDDGNIYVIKSDLIRRGVMFSGNAERIEISREQNIEIDDEFDFWLAEQILLKRQKEEDEFVEIKNSK